MSKIVTSMIHYRLCLHRRDLKIYGIFLCCEYIYKDVKKNLFKKKKNKMNTYRYRVTETFEIKIFGIQGL